METIEKIHHLIQSGKIYAPANRCWYTCITAYTKLTKSEKKGVKLVNGLRDGYNHYWLVVDGQIVDVHDSIMEQTLWVVDDQTYEPEEELSLENLKLSRELSGEERPSVNYLGKEKWLKLKSHNYEL